MRQKYLGQDVVFWCKSNQTKGMKSECHVWEQSSGDELSWGLLLYAIALG